jgi:5-methylthioadenosine/S-adenosylhomocysteine deaminase
LLEEVAKLSRKHGVMVHTHASENRDEIALVETLTGKRNIEYLRDVGLAASHVVLAHCVWLNESEMEILRSTRTHVSHCPSSNLKLASGIARIPEMVERGISVSLGADGAPCNNRLDVFTEMRTAALIQKALHGPQTFPALTALRMATINGAKALGLGDAIGSIEVGKQADLILLNLTTLHTIPRPDLVSAIVYAAEASNVESVIIDGRILMRGREFLRMNEGQILAEATIQAEKLLNTI